MKKVILLIVALFIILAVSGLVFRVVSNNVDYAEHKIDEYTKYELLRQVEDTCRAMMANYTADKLIYEQYKDSDDKEKQGWGEQAKMRANRTAATYNEYILKNSYLWGANVPSDIKESLDYIQ